MNRYELNVSLDGDHYCKIIIPSNLTRNEVVVRARHIALAFFPPSPEDVRGGPKFEFNLTAWSEEGTPLNMD